MPDELTLLLRFPEIRAVVERLLADLSPIVDEFFADEVDALLRDLDKTDA